jgi:small ligand-binding sensory domain FIST
MLFNPGCRQHGRIWLFLLSAITVLLTTSVVVRFIPAPQAATSKQELLQLLSNMALGLMPETLRAADGPQPEAQDFLIRGMAIDKAGFMVVGDAVRVGQRVRFMVSVAAADGLWI